MKTHSTGTTAGRLAILWKGNVWSTHFKTDGFPNKYLTTLPTGRIWSNGNNGVWQNVLGVLWWWKIRSILSTVCTWRWPPCGHWHYPHSKKWLKEEDTDPAIIQALTTGLQSWYQGVAPQSGSPALVLQLLLGWDSALDGWLGIEWRLQQEAYWNQWKWKKSSKRWTLELIKKLWNIAWDMWDHCNGILHHADRPHDDVLDSAINNQVRQLFSYRVQAVPWDAFTFFQHPLEEVLENSRQYKEQWVASVQAAIWQKQQHDHGAYLAEQQFMRRWLGLE